jgi:hypothetical protein
MCGPSFVGWISNHGQFPDVFADAGNGFVRAPFCVVDAPRTKQTGAFRRGMAKKSAGIDKEPARLAGQGRAG